MAGAWGCPTPMIRMLPGTPAGCGGTPARTTLAVVADAQRAAVTGPQTAAVTAYRWRERGARGQGGERRIKWERAGDGRQVW